MAAAPTRLTSRSPLRIGGAFTIMTVLASALAIVRARDVALPISPGDSPTCPWRSDRACVRAIQGVRLDTYTLSVEVEYVPGVAARRQWFAQQAALHQQLGEGPTARVELDAGAREVPVRRRPIAEGLRVGLPGVVVGVVLLAISFFVLRRRPDAAAARSLFGLCVGIFACLLPTFSNSARGIALDAPTNALVWAVNLVGLASCGAFTLRLAATFPWLPSARRSKLFGGAVPVGLGVVAVFLDLIGLVPWAAVGFAVGALAVASVWMLLAYRRATSQVQALQARWMAWGFSIPFVVLGLSRVPLLLPGNAAQDPHDALVTPSIVAFPIAIGVAILRARLFDIEVVIRRTAAGAVITAAALFAYHLALSSFSVRPDAASGFGATFLTAMVLSFTLQPVQRALEARLDRLFFRNRHDYHHALARLPDALAGCADAADAAAHILRALHTVMEARVALVALAPPIGGSVWCEGVDAPPPPPWDALRETHDTRISDTEADDAVSAWMSALGVEALFPLRTSDAFIGVLACARPRGVAVFSADDIELLHATASSLALAMGRAAAFDTIRAMNASLEDTVRRRTEELDAVRMRLYQREKMSSLAVLAAGVAHELNTPLGVVASTSQLLVESLAREGAPERTTRLATLCLEGARRAAETVGALLAFSRPGARGPEWADLRACAEGALRLAGPTLRQRGVTGRVEMSDGPAVLCHPALVGQALLNLLLNAAAAMSSGGEVRVTREAAPDGACRLVVTDTGPGIDPAVRSRIFEPFFTTKAPGEGTGLGLALCFAIMELHGGRIWEDGELGRGARFVMELPAGDQRASSRAARTTSASASSE